MSPSAMTNDHDCAARAPWQWCLTSRSARRVAPAAGLRWLAVEQGRVWLTRSQQSLDGADDIWLNAGDRLPLPPGSEWVAEGWPEAQVVLLQAPERS